MHVREALSLANQTHFRPASFLAISDKYDVPINHTESDTRQQSISPKRASLNPMKNCAEIRFKPMTLCYKSTDLPPSQEGNQQEAIQPEFGKFDKRSNIFSEKTPINGGSRISPRRDVKPSGGANIRFCQFFSKTEWKWKNLDPWS